MKFNNLEGLYQYFDQLVEQESHADILFASSYLRGFITLAASEFGDDQQPLTQLLAEQVSEQLLQARTELTPADRTIVNDYWQELKTYFLA